MEITQKLQELGIELKGSLRQQKTLCPKCSHQRKNKKEPCLSVNLDDGLYFCHHCGYSGNVLGNEMKYEKPIFSDSVLSDATLKYFKKRGISQTTLSHWEVTESKEYFGQVEKERTAINFNYYRDGNLINVKYRDGSKNFKLSKGAELIFYGLDFIKDADSCYITEGEFDALSLFEAGVKNVVSVPNGANKGNQKLTYLDNCFQYFENKKKIILCTDNDEAGISLRNELGRRFGFDKCQYVDFGTYKDANEILVKEGASYLRNVVNDLKSFPIDGILNIDEVWQDVLNFNENGIQNYGLGLGDSDKYLKIQMGQWSIFTGIPNSGKSDVVDQICLNLASNNDFRIAFYAPESWPFEGHIKRLANKYLGTNCNTNELNKAKSFIIEHFDFVKIDLNDLSLKSLLNKFKELVLRKGTNIFVIDPWNMLDHSENMSLNYISRMLSIITQFCQKTNTHLFLVAHPRKMEMTERGKYKVPTPYDISGSSDFFNKSFNCVTVFRNLGDRTEYNSDSVDIHIQKVKRKENGQQGVFSVAPDFANGGVYRHVEGSTNEGVSIPF